MLLPTLRPVLVSCTLAAVCLAAADDLFPAPYRGQNATATTQEWDYFTGAVPLVADGNLWGTRGSGFVNPFGAPALHQVSNNAFWTAQAGGGTIGVRQGVWQLPPAGEVIAHLVPSQASATDSQAHWVQVTWHSVLGPLNPPVILVATGAGPTPATLVSSRALADGWFHGTFAVTSAECLELPRVSILSAGANFLIDQVVVDAICTRRTIVMPDGLVLRFGRIDAGNVASLLADDGDVLRVCRFIVPNTTVPPVQVEIGASGSSLTNLLSLSLKVKSRMATAGSFRQTIEHFDFSQASFGSGLNTQPFPPTFAVYNVSALGNLGNYLGPNGSLRGRWSIVQTGPAAVSAWCAEIEQWEWVATY